MPLPQSPLSKVEFEFDAVPTPPSSKTRRKHHKKPHGTSSRSEVPLTWKEQLLQLLAVLVTAAVVYCVTVASIGWLKEVRKPFCNEQQEPMQGLKRLDGTMMDPMWNDFDKLSVKILSVGMLRAPAVFSGLQLSSILLVVMNDDCRPCPSNGYCTEGRLRCLPGFKQQRYSCVPDKEIDRIAQKLGNFVQNKVCRMAGEALCTGREITWVPEDELWETSIETSMGLVSENVWLVHGKTLHLVRDKLNIRIDDFGMRKFQCPTDVAKSYRPLRCWIRQGIRANMYGVIVTVFIVFCLVLYTLRTLQRKRLLGRAEELYLEVCEVLVEKALDGNEGVKWVVASRLRDHLLLPSERKSTALWKEVEGLVQGDSRIDQYPKVVNGESRIVWEWQVEGAVRTLNKGTKR